MCEEQAKAFYTSLQGLGLGGGVGEGSLKINLHIGTLVHAGATLKQSRIPSPDLLITSAASSFLALLLPPPPRVRTWQNAKAGLSKTN